MKLINISELSKILKLVDNDGKPQNHILRYWEKEFKILKPKMINNRRYYSPEQIEKFKLVKFLLKEKGFTINGAKSIINSKLNQLDDNYNNSLKDTEYINKLKFKTKQILQKLKRLKKYGKKISH